MQMFLDYLTALPPDGETLLFVRQKPVVKDGEHLTHADGSRKYTWPAFLPETATMRPAEAWYANTGSFVRERMGRVPSAAAANCDYVLVLVLDDVGDPAKAPRRSPLPPTWIMETSKDCYQWGYVFSEQPTKGEYAAAIRAIADAGYSDPGACNPVRNFRLPGSVNLKPERGGFAARLVEFKPEREYTLAAICEALGVRPGPADSAVQPVVRLADTGTDSVLAWLNEHGLVLSRPNSEGWVGVICPNYAEHTDGQTEGRYRPVTRAYCCLHSHCEGLDSARFLSWVAAQGGPDVAAGVRDDVLAATMKGALGALEAQLAPTPEAARLFSTDAAAEVIAEVDRREAGRVEKANWHQRFAYVESDDAYFDMVTRREYSRPVFNALFRHVHCKSIHAPYRRVEASVSFDENRQAMGGRALCAITYAAGDSALVARQGDVYGNRWVDARPPRGPAGDVTPWLEHCRVLVPEPAELEHCLNVMAFKLQHPRVKINHAVLHGGDEGCGKDTMWAPFIRAVCGPDARNRGLVDNNGLDSNFGYHLESEILLLNELKEPEARERRALANRLKPVIAAPPDTLTVNRKGLHPYDAANRLLVLAFTNHPVPILLETQDRRWFCVWSAAPRMAAADAKRLWDWYRDGGFDAVGAWLYDRDVSSFNPAATPMSTDFKSTMIDNGRSAVESMLVEMLENRRGEFAKGVIAAPFHRLCDRLAGMTNAGAKVPQAALLHALKEAKWIDMGRVASGEYQTKKQLFAAPDMGHYTKSDLRRMVEESTVELKVVEGGKG